MDSIKKAINQFHNYGYIVEMDDFGSGYSSLNILKDLDFDIIKLDLRFFQVKFNIIFNNYITFN